MNAKEVVAELKTMASASTKKTLMNHGAREPIYGVKVGDMKKIHKRIKKDHQLALDLYATGISDAMYFAGLIADDPAMTEADLQRWVEEAYWYMLSEYTVPWVAAGNPKGYQMAQKWIESPVEMIQSAGWSTFSNWVATHDDTELKLPELKKLLTRVKKNIHQAPNRVRYTMNGFIIAVGGYVEPLTDEAVDIGMKVGEVTGDMGGTSCKVPDAIGYIVKMQQLGKIGQKKKTAKC